MKSVIAISLILMLSITILPVFAEHDEGYYDDDDDYYEYEEREHDEENESVFDELEERLGGESEKHEEFEDDERSTLDGKLSDSVLYGSVIAGIIVIAYSAFKIIKKKK